MSNLLMLERIVIESLGKKEKNIFELSLDTNLDQIVLLNIMPQLLLKNIVKYHRGIYTLSTDNIKSWNETINCTENIKAEVRELFTSMVNEFFADDIKKKEEYKELKIKKIWLTSDEEKVLKNHLLSLDNFFKQIQSNRKKFPIKERTHEQKVVFWGVSEYGKLLEGILEAV